IRFRLAARTDGRFTLARHPAARVCCVFERGWTISTGRREQSASIEITTLPTVVK
uniref:Uncharacterized protein n=1 Tax=Anopheles coluzzii TaxID=1518534 RepID=A0A6E8VW63_ANOCL